MDKLDTFDICKLWLDDIGREGNLATTSVKYLIFTKINHSDEHISTRRENAPWHNDFKKVRRSCTLQVYYELVINL